MVKLRTASTVNDHPTMRVGTTTVTPASVLITEQQVLLSTAAAVAIPRRRDTVGAVSAVVSSALAWWRARAERRPVRRDRPSRLSYLDNALMSREMDRL